MTRLRGLLQPGWIRKAFIIVIVEAVINLPLFPLISQSITELAQAAATDQQTALDNLSCPSPVSDTTAEDDTTVAPDQYSDTDVAGSTVNDPRFDFITEQTLNQSPFAANLKTQLSTSGVYDATAQGWYVCSGTTENLLSLIPLSNNQSKYLNTLSVVSDRITWANPTDQYALTGEPCDLYQADGTCNENPVTDAKGNPVIGVDGLPEYHYQDIYWPNGHWDAPKADARILETLVYLVTPISEGGAGHEHIKVGKILQASASDTPDPEFTEANSEDSTGEQSDEGDSTNSAHAYDLTNPEHPTQLATAVDITEIDNIRITTRITQKKRIGGNSTTYQYKTFPIKVGWQTQQGITQSPLPTLTDMFTGSQLSFGSSLAQLLDGLDLEATVDTSTMDVNSFGDVAEYLGKSVLTTLLGGGSLSGVDLTSTLDGFGRAYIANQLGLPVGSLGKGNDSDTMADIIQDVGRSIVETDLKLPSGSLEGSTSEEIYKNVAERYLEDTVFKVSAGTLRPGILTQQDLLSRLGQGKIEQRFSLVPGSVGKAKTAHDLQQLNYKTKATFTSDAAGFVDEALDLSYTDASKTHDFNQSDFNNPTSDMLSGKISLDKYEALVGSRVIDSGIGVFNANSATSPATQSISQAGTDATTLGNVNQVSSNILSSFGLNPADFRPVNLGGDLSQYTLGGRIATAQQSPAGTALTSTGLVSNQDIATWVTAADAQRTSDTKIALTPPQSSQVTSVANTLLTTELQPWKTTFQSTLDKIQSQIDTQATNQGSATPAAQKAQEVITQLNNSAQASIDGVTDLMFTNGQSGQSAALGLPGLIPTINTDGTYSNNSLFSRDPLATILGADLYTDPSFMTNLGKFEIGRSLTSNKISQISIASNLKKDLSPTLGALNNLGLTPSTLIDKGLQPEDFQRIFQQDLSADSFQRIGQMQLLQTVWNKSDIDSQIGNLNNNSGIQSVLGTAAQIAGDITFYQSHFKELTTTLQSISTTLKANNPALSAQIKGLSDSGSSSNVIDQIRGTAHTLEPLLKQASENVKQTQADVTKAEQILQEIAAGHDLSFTQSASASSNGTTQVASSCWTKELLRQALQQPGKKVAEFTLPAATCQLDQSLNLPAGSIASWLKNGGSTHFDLTSLQVAVGRVDAGDMNLDSTTAAKRGEKILETRALVTMASLIPGMTAFDSKYGVTSQTLVDLFNGNTTPLLRAVGGSTLDSSLHWSKGTAANLIAPECTVKDSSGNPVKDADGKTKVAACSTQDAANVRLETMAQLGLQQLGAQLNFPTSFDITSGGSFIGDFGKAQIGDDLHLAKNSFTGDFNQVSVLNSPTTLAHALGISSTPFESRMQQMLSAVSGLTHSTDQNVATAASNIVSTLQGSEISGSYFDALKSISTDPHSAYYDNPLSTGPPVSTMFNTFLDTYTSLVSDMQDLAKGNSQILTALKPFTDEVGKNSNDGWVKGYYANLSQEISQFQQTLTQLDARYNQKSGTFKDFILGQNNVTADSISSTVGTNDLKGLGSQVVGKLTDAYIDKALPADSPFRVIIDNFKELSQTDTCKDGLSLTDLIFGVKKTGCEFAGVGSGKISDLLIGGGPTGERGRTFLFDHFLSRTFSISLDQKAGFEPGTFRSMIIDPSHAQEIAMSQGIARIANQLFDTDSKDNVYTAQVKGDLKNAFLSAFYEVDPTTTTCSAPNGDGQNTTQSTNLQTCPINKVTNFNGSRALSTLSSSLVKTFTTDVQAQIRQRTGVTVALSDITSIGSGNMNGLLYVGLAKLAIQENTSLAKINDPRSGSFAINFNDIRNTLNLDDPTPEENTALFEQTAQATLAELQATTPLLNCAPATGQSARQYIAKNMDNPCAQIANQQAADAVAAYPQERQKSSQEHLQYQLMDITAFSIDHNIPRGFSQAMFTGTGEAKAKMIGEYAISALGIGQSIFNGALSADDIGNLVTFFNHPQDANEQTAVQAGALSKLDGWATGQLQKLGLSDLPSGTVTSFAAWASTGFNQSFLRSNESGKSPYTSGAFKGTAAFGDFIDSYSEAKLTGWADNMFHLQTGTVYKYYQSYQGYEKAFKALKSATSAVDIAKAAKGLAQARSDATSLAVDTLFAGSFSKADAQLGLVPGSTTMAVNALIDMAYGNWAGAGYEAIQFVVTNLFGVYKVTYDVQATADGYYPYKGQLGSTGYADANNTTTYQYPTPDNPVGTFDPRITVNYQAGVIHAAQAKTRSVLSDLLTMPDRWAPVIGVPGDKLWASQIFTDRNEDLQALEYLIDRPAPYETPHSNGLTSWGYGPLQDRGNVRYDAGSDTWFLDPDSGYRSGVFAAPQFWNQIHVRW